MRENIIYNNDFLISHGFSKETSRFLSVVGLPTQLDESIQDIISICFYNTNASKFVSYKNKKYLIVGNDGLLSLIIDPISGNIFTMNFADHASKGPLFVNSSVQLLIDCIKSFALHKKMLGEINYEEVLKNFKLSLERTDPQCIETNNAWWYIFVNQPY